MTDEKLEQINRDITTLKQDILTIQRLLARHVIISVHNECQERIFLKFELKEPDKYASLQRQLRDDASSAISQLDKSPKPLDIGREFSKKWNAELDKLGMGFLQFP